MATTLTATVQSTARVLLQLTWTPSVTSATVVRVHADGTTYPVRNAEPATVTSTTGVGWVGYDHEAPLDQAVTYRATSTQAPGTTINSSAVTVPSGGLTLLTHPGKPSLGGYVIVRDEPERALPARRGLHQVIGSAMPVAVWDVRGSATGALVVQTTTAAHITMLRALLADGAPLLYRTPSTWGGGDWMYLAVGDTGLARVDGLVATDNLRRWVLPYVQVGRPGGGSQGAVGATYADVPIAYATYTATAAGEADYNALAIKPGA